MSERGLTTRPPRRERAPRHPSAAPPDAAPSHDPTWGRRTSEREPRARKAREGGRAVGREQAQSPKKIRPPLRPYVTRGGPFLQERDAHWPILRAEGCDWPRFARGSLRPMRAGCEGRVRRWSRPERWGSRARAAVCTWSPAAGLPSGAAGAAGAAAGLLGASGASEAR